jgi:Sulfotransferase domain
LVEHVDPSRVLTSRFMPSLLRRARLSYQSGLPRHGRVFGIGLSRTGTTSLTRALTTLGFRTIHYPEDEETREEVLRCLRDDCARLRLSVLEKFDAATDTPICVRFEALDAAYPGSRFILTTRQKPAWLDSCRRYWGTWIEPLLRENDGSAAYMAAIHESLYGGAEFDATRFSRAYDAYHARVSAYFRDRPSDLLRLDICGGDGWPRLCELLGAPVPRAEFPWDRNH